MSFLTLSRLERLRSALTLAHVRMEWKLILVFLVLILIPIPLLGYVSYRHYADSIQNNTTVYVTEVSNEMVKRLDDYIDDMKRISTIPAYVEDIKDNLELSNDFYEKAYREPPELIAGSAGTLDELSLNIRQKIESSINFLNNIKEDTKSVYLFDKYGNPYYRYKNGFRQDIKERYPYWKSAVQDSKGLPALIGTEQVVNNSNARNYVFSVIREVFNDSYEAIGLIVVDANISFFERIVQDLDKATHGSTLILDQYENVVYDSNKTFMTHNMANAGWLRNVDGRQGSYVAEVDGKQTLVIYSLSEQTQWHVVITVPVSELTKDVARNRNLTIAVTLLAVVTALIISVLLSFVLTRSLRILVNLMRQVQHGHLDVKYPVKYKDEIGRLGNQFNRMLERIKQLLAENVSIGERKREAELAALQTQINPHFIYNTLESIRMTAEINDDSEVADMTQILGKLLRYGITMGRDFVRLEQELDHLRNYMKLQDYRYPGKFRLSIAPHAELKSVKLLKLTLQPIVENAIFHGLDGTKPVMELALTFTVTGNELRITICDSGAGMDEATLGRLRQSLLAPEAPAEDGAGAARSGGIGLRNVNERLKLYYGDGCGLEVDSEPGVGTQVHIRFPLQE
ncbi:sensor histidine kinase [Paenibacillus athensensis]|uniref:Two-component sensor histidine kinase n=1 Tax=Paenibacillus athensensis TaxID=1967502 RepID=A0A4Y8Q985_9BACL|nr:sensor histidine kinase [Paenibacillus athensensis]MCD1258959.1 sensor histidine kinase [Paenibacillus athensensis]